MNPENLPTPPVNEQDLLKLSPWDFDQSANGWRGIINPDDPESNLKAVNIMRKYLEINSERIKNQPKDNPVIKPQIIQFHIGQLLANTDPMYYQEAIAAFEQSYHLDKEDPWNDYVNATIGYLRQDEPAVERAFNAVSNIPENHPLKMNANKHVIEALKRALKEGIQEYKRIPSLIK
jgi:tetratricopeptide (TPR) repeat protein